MDSEVQITSAGGVGYTDPFAAGEKLAIQFNVERSTSGSGTLTVTPQSSADGGITWIDKSAIVSAVAFAASAVTPLFGTDNGVTPHHDLMRLMVSTSVIANVRIFIHMRGRARPVKRLVYDGIVPTASLYSRPFALDPGTTYAAVQALVTPVGANTTPTITAQLEVSHDGNNWGNQTTTAEIAASVTTRQENSVSGVLTLRAARGPVGRIRLVSGNASADNASHVRVYVTQWVKPPKANGGARPNPLGYQPLRTDHEADAAWDETPWMRSRQPPDGYRPIVVRDSVLGTAARPRRSTGDPFTGG